MKKFWFLIASENDGSFQKILKGLKEHSGDIYDYDISKRFDIDGTSIRSISMVCDQETFEKVKNCGFETHDFVLKD